MSYFFSATLRQDVSNFTFAKIFCKCKKAVLHCSMCKYLTNPTLLEAKSMPPKVSIWILRVLGPEWQLPDG